MLLKNRDRSRSLCRSRFFIALNCFIGKYIRRQYTFK